MGSSSRDGSPSASPKSPRRYRHEDYSRPSSAPGIPHSHRSVSPSPSLRLASKGSVSVPPLSQGAPSIQTHLTSTQASFRKEINDYRTRFLNLERDYQKLAEKNVEYNGELRRLRSLAEAQEKEIVSTRKNIERILAEKQQLSSQSKADKDLIRKLEGKLMAGLRGQAHGLAEKNVELIGKMDKLKESKREQEAMLQKRDDEVDKLKEEIRILTRALDVHAEDLGIDGDLKSILLYDLAQNKMDNERLRGDVEALHATIDDLRKEADGLRVEIEDAASGKERAQQETVEIDRKLQDLQREIETQQKVNEDLQVERGVMLEYIQEQEGKMQELEQRLHHTESDMHTMEDELSGRIDALTESERRAREEAALVRRAADDKIQSFTKVVEMTEISLRQKKDEAAQLRKELDEAVEAKRDLREEILNLHSEIDSLTEANERTRGELEDQIEKERSERVAAEMTLEKLRSSLPAVEASMRASIDEVAAENEQLRSQLRTTLAERGKKESELQSKVHALMEELKALTEERDHLRLAVSEAVTKCAASLASEENVKRELATTKEQAESVQKSKSMLQKTLLDQIEAVRVELQRSQNIREESEHRSNTEINSLKAQLEAIRRVESQLDALSPVSSPKPSFGPPLTARIPTPPTRIEPIGLPSTASIPQPHATGHISPTQLPQPIDLLRSTPAPPPFDPGALRSSFSSTSSTPLSKHIPPPPPSSSQTWPHSALIPQQQQQRSSSLLSPEPPEDYMPSLEELAGDGFIDSPRR
mmetsp:Transcript_18906/g.31013  ORF Transcript_18906/g.31013 Transcript_18906/m.31013 type:complete len:764 (+) Transcript_18906:76-2367(+)